MRIKVFRFVLFIVGLLFCLPILAVILGALKSDRELMTALLPVIGAGGGKISWHLLPLYPTAKHFIKLLFYTPEFFTVFWNSMKIVACILAGQLFVAVPAAFGFAKFSFRGKNALFMAYVILMLMPFSVMMLPSYLVLDRVNLMNTHWAVILPAVFSTFPVFLMYRGFKAIPKELYEAARIDGAGGGRFSLQSGFRLDRRGFYRRLCWGF